MADRVNVLVPVARELISWVGGLDAFAFAVTGKVVRVPQLDRAAGSPLTSHHVKFVRLRPGEQVIGVGYCKVVDAEPAGEDDDERDLDYFRFTFEVLGPGETASDTSADGG